MDSCTGNRAVAHAAISREHQWVALALARFAGFYSSPWSNHGHSICQNTHHHLPGSGLFSPGNLFGIQQIHLVPRMPRLSLILNWACLGGPTPLVQGTRSSSVTLHAIPFLWGHPFGPTCCLGPSPPLSTPEAAAAHLGAPRTGPFHWCSQVQGHRGPTTPPRPSGARGVHADVVRTSKCFAPLFLYHSNTCVNAQAVPTKLMGCRFFWIKWWAFPFHHALVSKMFFAKVQKYFKDLKKKKQKKPWN